MCSRGGAITHGGTPVMEAKSITTEKQYARRKRSLTLFLLVSLLIFGSALEASAASVKLAWDPSPEPLVTGYRLYYGTSSGILHECHRCREQNGLHRHGTRCGDHLLLCGNGLHRRRRREHLLQRNFVHHAGWPPLHRAVRPAAAADASSPRQPGAAGLRRRC